MRPHDYDAEEGSREEQKEEFYKKRNF